MYPAAPRAWRALGLLLLLGACTTMPPDRPAPESDLSWQQHRASVLAHDSWQLQGRLNIRHQDQSNTINLRWEQQPDSFTIHLSGALGLGATRIASRDGYVVIEKAGAEPIVAPSLEDISADYLGYEFPAGKLYYWIRGITAPGSQNSMVLNDNRRLASLTQGQWHLRYDGYRDTAAGVVLPGRIRMSHEPYRLTFLIAEWDMAPPAEAAATEARDSGR